MIHFPKPHNGFVIVNLLCAIIVVAASSVGFAYIPLTRLIEDAFCRQYYQYSGSETIDEEMCKEPKIQGQVAFIFAIMSMIDSIVGVLAALPWGIVADRHVLLSIGRKPVFAVNLLGMSLGIVWWLVVLSFQPIMSIWAGWLSSLTLLFGGGNAVLTAVIYGMVTDVAPEDSRPVFPTTIAILFMRIHVASLVGHLISPALSSAMMNVIGPRPVMCVAVALLLIAALAVLFIPETLQHPRTLTSSSSQSFKHHLVNAVKQLRESLLIPKAPLILLFFALFITAPAYHSTTQFLTQYVSKRYAIKLKDTGYVQTMYGCAQVFVALVGIPVASKLLTSEPGPRTPAQDQKRDFKLALLSFGILIPGFLLLGSAPTLVYFTFGLLILALGSGYISFARALASSHVDPEHRSRLFSLVGMLETAGTMYSGPLLAGLFSVGMSKRRQWIGLPYLVLAGFAAVGGVAMGFVRLPRSPVISGEGEEEADRRV
ncbi:MFS general substrate transporter [Stipitochalara longipes BDJ]|nr:MFS general substrate transporter [Stipitochalara longipes BDJ]